jgi:hypothetical protein
MAADDFLNRKQAAAYLRSQGCPIDHNRLANMAMKQNAGQGPPYTRYGWRTVIYSKAELDEWRRKRAVRVE